MVQVLLALLLIYFVFNVLITWFLIGTFFLVFKLVSAHGHSMFVTCGS